MDPDVVQEVEPASRGLRFADRTDSGEALKPPPMTRNLSKLSRSGTLNNLGALSRQNSQQHNQFLNFNHENWLLSILWIFKGDGKKVFINYGLVMLYTVTVVLVVEQTGSEAQTDLQQDVTVGLGGCMALMLAFRLNVCFSRWWEGRLLWGQVIVSCRSLVTLALSLEADFEAGSAEAGTRRAMAEGLAGWSVAFALTLKYHLRGSKLPEENVQFRAVERLLKPKNGCTKADTAFGAKALPRLRQSAHPPLHALRSIRHAIRRIIVRTRASGHDTIALETTLSQLCNEMHGALTGCERILRTPCPPGYAGVLRVSLLFFLFLFPFVLLEVGYWAIAIVAMTSFVLLGAEEVAIQLEQPFGDDMNDLPLDSYCFTLEADLMALLDEKLEDDDE